ncbi:MAG: probable oxidoreductase/Short-chain dehydrogenase, partial [uncultured Blastococcus sp.]
RGVHRRVGDPGRARERGPAGQQRRGDGDAAADDGRRVRAAAGRGPPGALGVHRAPAAGPAARAVRPGGDGHEHGPVHGRPAGPGRSAHAAEVPGVGVLRAGEDGQLPLRAGPAAEVRGGRGAGVLAHRAPGVVEHRPAGADGAGGRYRLVGGLHPCDDRAGGDDAAGRGTAAVARGDGSEGPRWGAVRAAVRLERAAGAAPDPAPLRPAEADRRPVAGVRAGDRHPAGDL